MAHLGYISLDELTKEYGNRDTLLRCFHLNVQSLQNKTAELECLYNRIQNCFNVLMFTETWQAHETDAFYLPTMKTFYVHRTKRRGGGVSLLVENSLQARSLADFSAVTDSYEIVCVQAKDIVIAACYRPPDGNVCDFFEFLDNMLTFVNENHYNVIIGGDFNIDMSCNTSRRVEFENLLSSNACSNLINMATRLTPTSETTIDLFLANYDIGSITTAILLCSISDHMAICCKVDTNPFNTAESPAMFSQLISQKTLDSFRTELETTSWDYIRNIADANAAYEAFMGRFLCIYKKHFIRKERVKNKNYKKPWMTRELHKKIHKKDRLFKKFMNSRNEADLLAFKRFRNVLNKELKKCRDAYYFRYFSMCSGRMSELWSKMNALMGRGQEKDSVVEIIHDGKTLRGDAMVNAINEFFVNRNVTARPSGNNTMQSTANTNTFFLEPTDIQEVCSVFANLKNSRSCDADDVQISPVKYVLDVISPILTYIYNLCLSTAVYPTKMQVARVIPLYKKRVITEMFRTTAPYQYCLCFLKVWKKSYSNNFHVSATNMI